MSKRFLLLAGITLAAACFALAAGAAPHATAAAPAIDVAGPAAAPSAQPLAQAPWMRRNHSLVYDSQGDRLVVFGGWNGQRFFNDTWALDLDTHIWRPLEAAGGPPPARAWHLAAMDKYEPLGRSRMVLLGGAGYGGEMEDAWALDLHPGQEAWTDLAPTGPFSPRRLMAGDFDASINNMLFFGGLAGGEPLGETIHFAADVGGASWTRPLMDGTPPTARYGASGVWDDDNGQLVVFGGSDGDGLQNDVYLYRRFDTPLPTWTELVPADTPPPARRFHTAVYYHDQSGEEAMLVFGGQGEGGFLNDLWKLVLTPGEEAWQQISPVGSPPAPRAGHAATANPPYESLMYVVGGFGPDAGPGEQEWVLNLASYRWEPLETTFEWRGLQTSLHVEDALEGVVVNALPESQVAVAVKLATYDPALTEDLTVTLTVHGDVLDFLEVRARITDGGDGTVFPLASAQNGHYQVSGVDLLELEGLYQRQVVFHFYLPYDVYLGDVSLTARVQVPGVARSWYNSGLLRTVDQADLLIVANRARLYTGYYDAEVSALLATLYQVAQGGRRSDNPLGIVINADRYTDVENWDNEIVDYGSEAAANVMATAVRDEIRHFYAEADGPPYLLIVGDDDLIPFYRHYDPTGWEAERCTQIQSFDTCPASNTALKSLRLNYYFTDGFYADAAGDDWTTGQVELATGRLVGETPADMLTLLLSGITSARQQTGRALLFSLDGAQLGLLPVGGQPDAIPNLLNVPARFTELGYDVRNDDEVPRTIDVLAPDWPVDSLLPPLMEAGFDLFFHSGNSGTYHFVWMPDSLYAGELDDYRLNTDHPLFVLSSSYQALPVPEPEGGADDDLALALARAGSSGIVGNMAQGYGSVGSLDYCVYGEQLEQRFLDALLSPDAGESLPVGVALQQAKRDYSFGLVSGMCYAEPGLDEVIVSQHVLHGVPWQTMPYPAAGEALSSSSPGVEDGQPIPGLAAGPVGRQPDGAYSQTFIVDFQPYTVTPSGTWQILTVPDTYIDVGDGYPLLPVRDVVTLCLPISATVTGVQVIDDSATAAGSYQIPTVRILPGEEGGLVYTTTTAIAGLYPPTVAAVEQHGRLWVLSVAPLQHNPSTGETVFHDHLELRVDYTAPSPVAICRLRVGGGESLPGETLEALALVRNVGDVGLTLTPTLSLRDPSTGTLSVQVGQPFPLAAGAWHAVPMSLTLPLEEGAYRAVFSAWSQGQRLALAFRSVEVRAGAIVGLEGPDGLRAAGPYTFGVTFANRRPGSGYAFVSLSLLDFQGRTLEVLPGQIISVPGQSAATATFQWQPDALPRGGYQAVAWVMAGEQVYGPLSRSFPTRRVYLPLVVRDGP